MRTFQRPLSGRPLSVADRWHLLATALLLVLTFVTGGSSFDRGPGDVAAQLLSIPLLAWSVWWATGPRSRCGLWALAATALVLGVVAIQCLPQASTGWQSNPARANLLRDLATAGVDLTHLHRSLTPLATEKGVWALLPGLALFMAAFRLDKVGRNSMVLLALGLILLSVMLGYLQYGAGQHSLLNPFPALAPAFNGLFASPNHQATAIGMGLALAVALLLDRPAGRPQRSFRPGGWQRVFPGLTALVLLVSLPGTGSRAMGVLAVLGALAVWILGGHVQRALGSDRLPRWLVWWCCAFAALLVVGAALLTLYWLQIDVRQEVRVALAIASAGMGWQLAPWGGGVGSFVPWFDQFAPDPLFRWEYFNHAHNEYIQWWVEGGVPNMLVVVAGLLWLLHSRPRLTEAGGGARMSATGMGSWVAVVVVLAHSLVDYPLRTPAIMGLAALLAGIAITESSRRSRQRADGDALP